MINRKLTTNSILLRSFIKVKHEAGVTLIEGLIAMTVFSLGALGLAAMQLSAMTQTDDIKKSTLVSFKVQGLIERMQKTVSNTNPNGLYGVYAGEIRNLPGNNGATEFAGSGIGLDRANEVINCSAGVAPKACSAVGACTSNELIARDVWDVFCDADTGLAASAVELGANDKSGVVGLGAQVQVLMVVDPNKGNELYIETVSNSEDGNSERFEKIIKTNLCGQERDVVAALDVFCIKF